MVSMISLIALVIGVACSPSVGASADVRPAIVSPVAPEHIGQTSWSFPSPPSDPFQERATVLDDEEESEEDEQALGSQPFRVMAPKRCGIREPHRARTARTSRRTRRSPRSPPTL